MAKEFSRKWLEALGLEGDKIDVLSEAHSGIVADIVKERDALKAQIDSMKETMVEKSELTKVQKELDDIKTAAAAKAEHESKAAAFKAAYAEAGIADKFIPALLNIADYANIEVGSDGKAKNHNELVEAAKRNYAEFIPVVKEVPAQKTATPPVAAAPVNYDTMSDADYYKATYEASKKKG